MEVTPLRGRSFHANCHHEADDSSSFAQLEMQGLGEREHASNGKEFLHFHKHSFDLKRYDDQLDEDRHLELRSKTPSKPHNTALVWRPPHHDG